MKNIAIKNGFLGSLVLLLCITTYYAAHLYSKNEAVQIELNKRKLVEEFYLSSKLQYEKEAQKVCQSYDKLVTENIALKDLLASESVKNSIFGQHFKK